MEIDDQKELTIATWNILAPCYHYSIQGGTHSTESDHKEKYTKRNLEIVDILLSKHEDVHSRINADIICLQEFWFQDEMMKMYENEFKSRNFSGSFLQRSGRKKDGLAIFFNNDKLQVEDCKSLLKDEIGYRVALLVKFKILNMPDSEQSNFLLVNTHLTFPHDVYDETVLRFNQIKTITHAVEEYIEKNNLGEIQVLLCGDLNSPYKRVDPILEHLINEHKYYSTFSSVHGHEAGCTHYNHCGEEVSVDFILAKNPHHWNRNSGHSRSEMNFVSMKPVESYVYPRNLSHSTWPHKKFNLSDHRPVVTKLQVTNKNENKE